MSTLTWLAYLLGALTTWLLLTPDTEPAHARPSEIVTDLMLALLWPLTLTVATGMALAESVDASPGRHARAGKLHLDRGAAVRSVAVTPDDAGTEPDNPHRNPVTPSPRTTTVMYSDLPRAGASEPLEHRLYPAVVTRSEVLARAAALDLGADGLGAPPAGKPRLAIVRPIPVELSGSTVTLREAPRSGGRP